MSVNTASWNQSASLPPFRVGTPSKIAVHSTMWAMFGDRIVRNHAKSNVQHNHAFTPTAGSCTDDVALLLTAAMDPSGQMHWSARSWSTLRVCVAVVVPDVEAPRWSGLASDSLHIVPMLKVFQRVPSVEVMVANFVRTLHVDEGG